MDRAAELRALMKAKPGGNLMSTLSGKDKVKYLKSLRESQKTNFVQTKPVQSQALDNPPMPLDSSSNKPVRVVSIPTLIKQKIAPSSASNTDNDKHLKNAPISSNGIISQTTGLGLVEYGDEDEDENEEELESSKDASLNHKSSSNSTVGVSNPPPEDFFDDQPPAGFFDEPIVSSLPVNTINAAITNEGERYSGLNDYDSSNKSSRSKVQRVNAADIYTGELLMLHSLLILR
jgi:hypothetical protein